jgi:hypothetical protein
MDAGGFGGIYRDVGIWYVELRPENEWLSFGDAIARLPKDEAEGLGITMSACLHDERYRAAKIYWATLMRNKYNPE